MVPYLDADGDPTDPTTPDTEVSKDAAAFSDCTEEVTTISGSNGLGYITLTGDEMNCNMIGLCAKVASGPKATIATLYPRSLPVLETGTAQAGAASTITLATAALQIDGYYCGAIITTTSGTGAAGGSGALGNQARMITAYVGSTRVATLAASWETTPDNTTAYTIVVTEFWAARQANVTAWNGTIVATPATAGIPDVNTKNAGNTAWASGAITAASIATDAIDADALKSDAVAEIAVAVRDIDNTTPAGSSLGAAVNSAASAGDPWNTSIPGAYAAGKAGYIIGTNLDALVSSRLASASYTAPSNSDITAIKAKTDNLPAAPASTTNITAGTITTVGTVTNLTNAPTSGDFTATMKTSITTAATAATPIAASVTGNVGGNVTGSVGSIASGGIASTSFASGAITAAAIAADAIGASELAADAVAEIQSGLATSTALATAQTAITAIKGKTDNLPSDPADASDIAALFTANSPNWYTFKLAPAFTSTAGTTLRLVGLVEYRGQRKDVYTADNTATCALAVREHGAGSDLFTITATTVNANGTFELSKSSPGFTADRLYRYTATVVISGVTYTFEDAFPNLG